MTTPDPFSRPDQPGTPPPAGWGPPPTSHGPPGQWQPAPKTETKAMIALGLAIAAYTPTIPFIGAIAAIVLAQMARRDIDASRGALTGRELCTWALWLSVVHLVLVTILFLVFGLFFLVPFAFLL